MIKTVAALDFETTGTDVAQGQVIEGAVVLMEVLEGSGGGKVLSRELDSYSSMNDPGRPIPPEIVKLTGITDEMVAGQRLDWERFNAVLAKADLLVAHNARFDRAWLEAFGKFQSTKWGCTFQMIEWKKEHGMPCATLRHIAWEHGHFPNSHRALDDVRTLLHLLKMPSRGNPAQTYFELLALNATTGRRLVLAKGSPFEKKDLLKERSFQWSPLKRVWWKLLPEAEWVLMQPWLDKEIYGGRPLYETVPQADYLSPAFRSQYGLE